MRFLSLVAILLFIFVFSCTEAPYQPKPNGPQGYKVYIRDQISLDRWYIYYPESDYLDSIYFPPISGEQTIHDASISPNGDKLYWSIYGSSDLIVVDTKTGEQIHEFNNYNVASVSHSPDGQYLSIRTMTSLMEILNADDLSLVYRDTASQLTNVVFDSNNHTLHGTVYDADLHLGYRGSTEIDDLPNIITDTIVWENEPFSCWQVLPGSTPHQSFVFGPVNSSFMFFELNTTTNDVVYVDTLLGSVFYQKIMVMSPNKYLVICITPSVPTLEPDERVCEFKVYDTQLHQQVDLVSTRIETSPGDTVFFDAVKMVITPDSKYAVCIANNINDQSNHLLVYNLEELKIERLVEIPGEHRLSTLACQTGE